MCLCPLKVSCRPGALARHGGNFHAKQINLAGETQSCLRSTSRVSLLHVKQFSFLYNITFCVFHDLNAKTENINVCFLHHSLKSLWASSWCGLSLLSFAHILFIPLRLMCLTRSLNCIIIDRLSHVAFIRL